MNNSFSEISFHEFNRKSILKIVIPIALFIALPVLVTNLFWLHVLILIFMYGVLGLSWNLIGGYTGQVSFMQAIFFGIRAYTSTVLSIKFGVNPWLGMFVGSCIAVIVSSIIGIFTFRLKGHYFAIATLGLGEIFGNIVRRWDFIGGARGLSIPMKEAGLINFQFDGKIGYYYIAFGLIVFAMLLTYMVQRSKLGYYFRAIKGNSIAAKSIGIDVLKFKLIAFALSAFIAALAGTFYAQYVLYIDPHSVLSNAISLQIVFIVILGGVGTIAGPVTGAFVLIVLQQFFSACFGGAKAIHLVIYGVSILLILLFEPDGLVAIYKNLYKKVMKI